MRSALAYSLPNIEICERRYVTADNTLTHHYAVEVSDRWTDPKETNKNIPNRWGLQYVGINAELCYYLEKIDGRQTSRFDKEKFFFPSRQLLPHLSYLQDIVPHLHFLAKENGKNHLELEYDWIRKLTFLRSSRILCIGRLEELETLFIIIL